MFRVPSVEPAGETSGSKKKLLTKELSIQAEMDAHELDAGEIEQGPHDGNRPPDGRRYTDASLKLFSKSWHVLVESGVQRARVP